MTEDQAIEYCKSLGFSQSSFTEEKTWSWYGDSMSETVTNWETIANLIHEVYEQPRADVNMLRVNGETKCWKCDKPYYKHPDNLYYRDEEGRPYLKNICGGTLGKL